MDAADGSAVRRAIGAQMGSLGARLVPTEQAVDNVRVTLSENAREYVWVAEMGRHEQNDVVMVSAPLRSSRPHDNATLISIRKTPLLSQPARILDVAVVSSPSGASSMLVLDADRVTLHEDAAGRWRSRSSALIAHVRPWPRDLRGRILIMQANTAPAAGYTAYLPGTQCSGSWMPD